MGMSISLLLILGMGGLAWATYSWQSRAGQQQVHEFGEVIANQLAASVTEPLFANASFELEVLLSNFVQNERIIGAAVYDHDHRLLTRAGVVPPARYLVFNRNEQTLTQDQLPPQAWGDHANLTRMLINISPVVYRGVTGGYVGVVLAEETMNAGFRRAMQTIVIISVLLCCAIIPLAVAMGRHMSRPIHDLVEATEAIGSDGKFYIPARRSDELGQLIDAINEMGRGLLHKSQVENRLELLLSPDVARKVLNNLDTFNIGGEQVRATVLFADIVGFTTISQQLSPREVSAFLNEFFGYFNRCCRFFLGIIDKYIGDCIMAVFGSEQPGGNHQYNAVACAVVMQRVLRKINAARERNGQFPVYLRIGINSGDMVAGMIGSPERMEHTVVGEAVNLASRLCGEAKEGQIIVAESLYNAIAKAHVPVAEWSKRIPVRGIDRNVMVYNVVDIDLDRGKLVDDLIDDLVTGRPMP